MNTYDLESKQDQPHGYDISDVAILGAVVVACIEWFSILVFLTIRTLEVQ